MKIHQPYFAVAGILALLTTGVHLIAGQIDLVQPLLNSALKSQAQTEWLGAWHMISGFLAISKDYLLRMAMKARNSADLAVGLLIFFCYAAAGFAFFGAWLWSGNFAPQGIVLLAVAGFFSSLCHHNDNLLSGNLNLSKYDYPGLFFLPWPSTHRAFLLASQRQLNNLIQGQMYHALFLPLYVHNPLI